MRKLSALLLVAALALGLLPAAAAAAEQVIVLQIDNLQATVDGKATTLQVPPQIINGRTMVPVRFVAEALGAQVDYEPVNRQITIKLGETTLQFWVDQRRAVLNLDEEIAIDQPPVVVNGRTLVPLRAAAEPLGGKVGYDANTRTVTLRFSLPDPQPKVAFPVHLSDAQFRAAFDHGRLNRSQSGLLAAYVRSGTSASGDAYTLKALTEWAAAADLGQARGGGLMESHDLVYLRALRGHVLLALTVSGRSADTLRQYNLKVMQKSNSLSLQPFQVLPQGDGVTISYLLPVKALDTMDAFTVEGAGPGGFRELTHSISLSSAGALEKVAGTGWAPEPSNVGILVALNEDQIREAWEWGRSRTHLAEDQILAGHSRRGSVATGEQFRADLLTEWQEAVLRGYAGGKAPGDLDLRALLNRRNQVAVRVAVSSTSPENVRNLTFKIDIGNRGVLTPTVGTPELVSAQSRTMATYRLSVPVAGMDVTGPFTVVASRDGRELFRGGWDLVYVDETGYASGNGPKLPQVLKNLTDHQRVLAWRYGIKLQREAPQKAAAIMAPYTVTDGKYKVGMNSEWVSAFFLGTQHTAGANVDPARLMPTEETLRQLLDARGKIYYAITVPPDKTGIPFELNVRNGSTNDNVITTPASTFHLQGVDSRYLNLSLPVEVTVRQGGFPVAYAKFDLSGINEAQNLADAAFTFEGPGAFEPLALQYTSLDAAVGFRYARSFAAATPGPGQEAVLVRRDRAGNLAGQLVLYAAQPTLITDAASLVPVVERATAEQVQQLQAQGMTIATIEDMSVLSKGGARLIVAQKGETQAYVLVLGLMRNQGAVYVLSGVATAQAQLETEASIRSFKPTGR